MSISQKTWLNSFNERMSEIFVEISSLASETSKSFSYLPISLQEAYDTIPVLTKSIILKLHSLGWYSYWSWQWGCDDVLKMNEMISSDNIDGIDNFMCEYVHNNINNIQDRLSNEYPVRYRLLELAFDSHQEAKYALSIPVFLAQTEGICTEILGTKFFSTDNSKPITYSYAASLALDGLDNIFLEYLKEVSPLNAREKDINQFNVRFNRHEVLHGVSTDYDTKINSYKSIALLDFLSGFVFRVKQDSII